MSLTSEPPHVSHARSFVPLLLLAFLSLIPAALANTIQIPADQPTIQAGINAAHNGDTVLVSPGTYYENIDFLGKAITVTSSNGPASTIIDGGNNAGIAVVAFKSQELRTSVLSGFTIQHGGTETATSQSFGGVYAHAAAPTIQNNIVVANRCSGIFANGGALVQGNTVTGTLYQNFGNIDLDPYCLPDGTGVYVSGTVAVGPYTHVEVIGNTITNNTQALGSGGIEVAGAEATLIQNNIISNNTSSYVGGIDAYNVSAVSIINNLVYANSAGVGNGPGHAGGLQLNGAGLSTIAGNTFVNNTLASGQSGESASQVNLSTSVPQLVLTNNIIVSSSPNFAALNCSVNYRGSNPTPAFDHNDVYALSGPAYGGACSSQTGLLGNISEEPQFVVSGSDFHLTSSSPAIDSGSNSEPGIPASDLDGNPRIQDATHKGYPVVDMGAYEYPGLLDGTPFSTTLTSSLNPASYGQNVTFSVTVAAISTGAAAPTGNITFTDGTIALSSQPLQSTSSTSASTQFTTASLTTGSHTITATYNTTTGSSASSASLTQVVTGIATTTTLSSALNPAPYGQAVTLTASVSGPSGSGTPTGAIRFMDGASILATQQLAPSGALTSSTAFASSFLSAGVHNLSAVYDGSGAFAPSSASLTENVIGISSTTTTLSASPSPSFLGSPVTFLATVTSTLPGAPPPTGVVTLTDGGNTVLNNIALVPSGNNTSQGSFSTNNLTLGGHAIQASYNPTGNFLGSIAAITQFVFLPPDFTITLANPTLTVQTQHQVTTTATLNSIGTFADTLALTCSNLPAHLTCTFTPKSATLTPTGTTTVSLTLDTANTTSNSISNHASTLTLALLLSPATLLFGIGTLRKRRTPLKLFLLLLAILPMTLTLGGCGVVTIPTVPSLSSIAPGTYTIPITATGASKGLAHTVQLTLTVTP